MVKSSANLKNVGVVSGFIKKPNGFPAILSFFRISQNCFYIEKSHGSSLWITGSRLPLSPWWTRDHRAARPLQAREVIVIYSSKREREREREDVVGVLTNGATWRQSCRDGHTRVLNRGG
jgi:hypothetical protein